MSRDVPLSGILLCRLAYLFLVLTILIPLVASRRVFGFYLFSAFFIFFWISAISVREGLKTVRNLLSSFLYKAKLRSKQNKQASKGEHFIVEGAGGSKTLAE